MLTLSNTTVRVFRKKTGQDSIILNSYLLVATNVGFSLSAYLRDLACKLRLANGSVIRFTSVAHSVGVLCELEMDHMLHTFYAKATTDLGDHTIGIGRLMLDYHVSFTGHPSEKPAVFEAVVPVVRCRSRYDQT